MTNVLITGATGNIGLSAINALSKMQHKLNIVAGVRDIEIDKDRLKGHKINIVKFDFTNYSTYKTALQNCDILFLLRPPQIAETDKFFKPLIKAAKDSGIKHIVFLSVQGVEKNKLIPHHKIEKLIVESKLLYTFLRPAYFMQNFTTTLNSDLVNKKIIFLPAGNSKFTLVDVRDIGNAAAVILSDVTKHINRSYELTCNQKLTFREMASKLSDVLGLKIKYTSPNLINFYLTKRKEKMPSMLILVMIMLHYFPRFQNEPVTTGCVDTITGKQPITPEGIL